MRQTTKKRKTVRQRQTQSLNSQSCSVYERRGSHGHATLKDMPPMGEKSHRSVFSLQDPFTTPPLRFISQSFAHPYAVVPLLALVAIWFTMIPFSIWDQHKLVDKGYLGPTAKRKMSFLVTPPGEFSTEHMAEVPAKKI